VWGKGSTCVEAGPAAARVEARAAAKLVEGGEPALRDGEAEQRPASGTGS
jgi:hypothetical protein